MNNGYCVDANIFITAWNVTYLEKVFPTLWEKLANNREHIILVKPIFDEIDPISSADSKLSLEEKRKKYPLRRWLLDNLFAPTPIVGHVENKSLELESKYQINHETRGANQNDIRLIAYASEQNKTIVTFEKTQGESPSSLCNYKIPLICSKEEVECIDFVAMLEGLKIAL